MSNPYNCKSCNAKISKWKYDNSKHCEDCDATLYINLKTGRKYEVDINTSGNPIRLKNGKYMKISEGTYIVKGKFNDEFFLINGGFEPNGIFIPKYDFTVKEIKKIIKKLEKIE